MSIYFTITQLSQLLDLQPYVFRNWEKLLELDIQRTENGRRRYSENDVELFKQIKDLRDKGYTFIEIKNQISNLIPTKVEEIDIIHSHDNNLVNNISKEKMLRIKTLMKEIVVETVKLANKDFCDDLKRELIIEMQSQFEQMKEMEKERTIRDENYYKEIDKMLRKYQNDAYHKDDCKKSIIKFGSFCKNKEK